MVNNMYNTIRHRVILVNDARILINIDEQRVIVKNVTVRGHRNIVTIHVDWIKRASHIRREICLVLHNMGTCKGITLFNRQGVERCIIILLEEVLDSIISRCKDRIVSVRLQHGEVVAAIQNILEVTELRIVSLDKASSSEAH